jgi:hypothetical protein
MRKMLATPERRHEEWRVGGVRAEGGGEGREGEGGYCLEHIYSHNLR